MKRGCLNYAFNICIIIYCIYMYYYIVYICTSRVEKVIIIIFKGLLKRIEFQKTADSPTYIYIYI